MKSKNLFWAIALAFAQFPLTAFAADPVDSLVDLTRDEAGRIFKNFRVTKAVTSNGAELHILGTFPEACADFFVISNSSNDAAIAQAGSLNIRIRDTGTKGRECIKAENKKGLCGGQGKICKSLSDLPGGRIALEDKDFSIQFARVNPEGDGDTQLETSSLQFPDGRSAEMISSATLREVSLELLKKDFENCKNSGRSEDYKTALEDLDELYRLGLYDDEGLDAQKELLAKKEYASLKENVEKLDAALMPGMIDDLEAFLSRYPERGDDVAKLMVAAGIKIAKADPSSESQYQAADEIFERAAGIPDISKATLIGANYARMASGLEHARPLAEQGSKAADQLKPLMRSIYDQIHDRKGFASLDRSVEHNAKVRRLDAGAALINQIYLNAVQAERQRAITEAQNEMAQKRQEELAEAQRRLAAFQAQQMPQNQPYQPLNPAQPNSLMGPNPAVPGQAPTWQPLW